MSARAIGYRRVSTSEQRERGLGLAAQLASITTAAARLGVPLVETFTDAGLSGALPVEKRPALLGAIGALHRGDVLIVAKRDRLGRDVLNVAILARLVARKGCRIVSAAGEGTDDDTPSGQLMSMLVDAFSQYERAMIADRTRRALDVKRQRGERISSLLPYGFTLAADGKTLEPRSDEQRVISVLRQLRAGGLSFSAVARELNRRGHRMRSGKPWVPSRVFALARDVRRAAARVA